MTPEHPELSPCEPPDPESYVCEMLHAIAEETRFAFRFEYLGGTRYPVAFTADVRRRLIGGNPTATARRRFERMLRHYVENG